MIERKDTDICLLCRSRKANATNSHWIPAAMLKSMIGTRNYEESYNIKNAPEARISDYYGRSNLKNTDPNLKDHHYAIDYIFCLRCEKKLSKIENAVIPVIQDEIRLPEKASNYKEELSLLKIPYKKCLHLSNAHFKLLIYSLIWRMCVVYELKHNKAILPVETVEELRELLDHYLSFTINELKSKSYEIKNYDFQVVTADYFIKASRNIVYTENIYSNPTISYLNEFIVLFYKDGYAIDPNNNYHLPVNSIVEFPEIINDNDQAPKIGFIIADHFDNLCKTVLIEAAEAYMNKLTKEVFDCSEVSYVESRRLIHQIGLDINRRTGKEIMECYYDASRIICDGLDN